MAIQSERNSDKGVAIISYLRWKLKKEALVDLPCYTHPDVQDDFRKTIWETCKKWRWQLSDEDTEIVKILAPLTDNPNAPNKDGNTPIHWAARNRHTEIVKILAPLTNNPNAPNNDGETPIEFSMFNFNVCRILMSFSISRKHN